MPETPLPQSPSADPDLNVGADDSRPRRKTGSSPAVTAFAPTRSSKVPAVKPSILTTADCDFISALHEACVALDLDGAELIRVAQVAQRDAGPARRIDMLEAYYAADGDPLLSQRRRTSDRWFVCSSDDQLTSSTLVRRLLAVAPELGDAQLERIGGREGTLILRSGAAVCGLEDDQRHANGLITVSIREVVRAFNVLLDRHGVRSRFVGLFGDGKREAYFGQTSLGSALALARAQYLDVPDPELLMQSTGW